MLTCLTVTILTAVVALADTEKDNLKHGLKLCDRANQTCEVVNKEKDALLLLKDTKIKTLETENDRLSKKGSSLFEKNEFWLIMGIIGGVVIAK